MLNPKALGLTVGVVLALGWVVVMGVSLLTGFLDQTVQGWGALHPGFTYTWGGLVWMAVMHLVGGFVGGYIFAWVYNKFSAKGM
jgi:hypothetical protein